jgi:serine/threonine protein kinase
MWGDRAVAVKKIRESIRSFDENADEEFAKEIKFMRTVRHANIVLFFGAGNIDGVPFLVTEFCSRGMSTSCAVTFYIFRYFCFPFVL